MDPATRWNEFRERAAAGGHESLRSEVAKEDKRFLLAVGRAAGIQVYSHGKPLGKDVVVGLLVEKLMTEAVGSQCHAVSVFSVL